MLKSLDVVYNELSDCVGYVDVYEFMYIHSVKCLVHFTDTGIVCAFDWTWSLLHWSCFFYMIDFNDKRWPALCCKAFIERSHARDTLLMKLTTAMGLIPSPCMVFHSVFGGDQLVWRKLFKSSFLKVWDPVYFYKVWSLWSIVQCFFDTAFQ